MKPYQLPIALQMPEPDKLISYLSSLGYSAFLSKDGISLTGNHSIKNTNQGLLLRPIRSDEKKKILEFQKEVLDGIPNNREENLCEALTEKEVVHSLEQDVFLGLFQEDRLVAFILFIPHPLPEQNLFLDLTVPVPGGQENVIIVDCILVGKEYRGYGIQQFLFRIAEFWAISHEIPMLAGVASPKNLHSNANFQKSDYQLVATKPKYHSVRNYYLRKL